MSRIFAINDRCLIMKLTIDRVLQEGSTTLTLSTAKYEFDCASDLWVLNRNVKVNLKRINFFSIRQLEDIRESLTYYAETQSGYATFNIVQCLKLYLKVTNENELSEVGFISLKRALEKKHEWKVSVLRGFVRQMRNLGLHKNIDPAVYKLTDQWVLSGNDKGTAVLSLDPENGPFSPLEFEAIGAVSAQKYAEGAISTESYATILLFKATGRRPDQIASLKFKDFSITDHLTGQSIYVVKVPRAKQRNGGFRKGFRNFGLENYVGQVVEEFKKEVFEKANEYAGRVLSDAERDELPLFISKKGLKGIKENAGKDLLGYLKTEDAHTIRKSLSDKLIRYIGQLEITSERTGRILYANPYRFRYTLGTRAAIEGAGVLTIATLLDHSDTQNVEVYVANVPEYAIEISKIMNQPLARYASAFAGTIVEDEAQANIENKGATRIPLREKNCDVGSCGSSSYCQDYAPVACYLCPKFRPWAHAPHHLVLAWLMEERERVRAESGDLTIVSINDRAIIAVCQVIKMCEERNNV